MTELCRSHKRALPFQLTLAKKNKAKNQRQSNKASKARLTSDSVWNRLSLLLSPYEMISVRGKHLER